MNAGNLIARKRRFCFLRIEAVGEKKIFEPQR